MSLRERNKARTLEAIRQAAAELFARQGYAETRTRDIAEAAGIATGTLFNYAPTKEAVVLLLWMDHAQKAVETGLRAAQAASDPVDACVALFHPIFSFYGEDLELGRVFLQHVMFMQSEDPEFRQLNEGFIGQIALLLVPHAGDGALTAAVNVFAAYYTTLTAMLAERLPGVPATEQMFRELVRGQARGWRAPG
ncbi:MAG: helix-turn-helix domain-containing protein [Myxococcota bacterium]